MLVFGLAVLAACTADAQVLEGSISVNYESVSTTNKDLLANFESDLQNYFSGYQWGPDSDIRVSFSISVFVKSVIGDNRYSAQAAIVSQREQLIKSELNTPMLRVMDESWDFTYVQGRPLNHNPSVFNDLTSFLDFYAYTILGYDYDSYEPLGGTTWFQKAADMSNLGRSSGQKGWQSATGSYSRTQLIDELLNQQFTPVRLASHKYHFAGLDSLQISPSKAYHRIIEALEGIGSVRKKVDPRNLVIKAFFDAKHQEIAEILQGYDDPSFYMKMNVIDPTHTATYEEYRKRRE
jgi:hypothetical protein